ncbi:MAG: crotonase/enoyl-CoA hydratase family protein [Candidatus Hydrogenedentes bacterium]|nr:crotonase/enoyl-CoA hydratase family protein [Candidatus Hydrogenedentota bacterium]
MSEEYTVIRLDRRGDVAEVVLNNPDRLNAMAPIFFQEIRRVFEEIDQDPEIRVAILWAEGRLFTAGLDLKASAGTLGADPSNGSGSMVNQNYAFYRHVRELQACFSAPEKCRKPVIAAVHGHCIGGGVDLTTACDIRLCTEDATFAIHETKIAIVADVGTLQRITAIVGKGVAREMAYTGKRFPADRALHCGLVNATYPDKDALLDGARAMAAEIAANSPLAVMGTKAVLQYSEERTIDEGLEYVAQWNSSFLRSNDLMEAMQAFVEKRTPEFKGS